MTNPPEDQSHTDFGDPRWSRVKRLFHDALELPVEQRNEFLDRECGDDADIHAELRGMLDDAEDAARYFDPEEKPVARRTFENGAVLVNRFRIIDFIGSGGMGQVYHAEDMLSGGPVALKAIRPEIAADTQTSRRFRRELRLSRQVSHPNVCRVYELWSMPAENGPEVVFLTMELLEGETLAARLARTGRLTPKAALPIARQIAAGVAEVHRIGIVHRDVKPSNVFLVPDGAGNDRAVVMDFGLARTALLTGAPDVTVAGTVLGTPAYMAPELFEGKEATICSDVYGFGVTLYEMLTGNNRMVISPRKLVAGLHGGWERAIQQCVQPDPKKRPSSMGNVISLIEKGPKRGRLQIALVGGAVLACVLIVLLLFSHPPSSPAGNEKIARLTFDKGIVQEVSYSRDGKTMVYASDQGSSEGNLNLWIDDSITGDRHPLVKSPWNDYAPAVSPDGKLVAFHSDREGSGLYTVPTAGGSPKFLVAYGHNPRFSADGKFIAYWVGQPGDVSEAVSRGYVIPASGGDPRLIAPQFADVRFPVWSPSGRQILFWGAPSGWPSVVEDTDWYVEDMDTGALTRTRAFAAFHRLNIDPHSAPVFWDRDSLVFSARSTYSNNLWKMSFSQRSPDSVGEPHRLTTGAGFEVIPWVLANGNITYASWAVAVRISRVGTWPGQHRMEPVTEEDARDMRPTISKNGRFLLFSRRVSDALTIYLHDQVLGTETTVTKADRRYPAISPDGKNAAYLEFTPGGARIWIKAISTGIETAVCQKCGPLLSWLPDNRALLYLQSSSPKASQVRMLDLQTHADSTILDGDLFTTAAVSPDMKHIAFTAVANASNSAIYVAPFARGEATGTSSRIPLTGESVWEEKPQWSDDGGEIFFSSNRDGFICLWRQRVGRDGKSIGKPGALLHIHKAAESPMHLARVPTYNLAYASRYLYFNTSSVAGNLWQLQP